MYFYCSLSFIDESFSSLPVPLYFLFPLFSDHPLKNIGIAGSVSPDVFSTSSLNEGEQDFYVIKKDTERRATIVSVLEADSSSICHQCFDELTREIEGTLLLNSQHLDNLLNSLREFIPRSDKSCLINAISQVKASIFTMLNGAVDEKMLNGQLECAFYKLLDSINTALRRHSIKPHWMFAFNGLLRDAISCAFTILNPDPLANQVPMIITEDPDATPTPTFSSQRSILDRQFSNSQQHATCSGDLNIINRSNQRDKNGNDAFLSSEEVQIWQERCKKLRAENELLWQEKYRKEQTIQDLLKSQISSSDQLIASLLSSNSHREGSNCCVRIINPTCNCTVSSPNASQPSNNLPPIVIDSPASSPNIRPSSEFAVPNHIDNTFNFNSHPLSSRGNSNLSTTSVNSVNCTNAYNQPFSTSSSPATSSSSSSSAAVAGAITATPSPASPTVMPLVVICQCCRQNSTSSN